MTSLLLSEIHEQPQAVSRLLAAETQHVADIGVQLQSRQFNYILIAARGTSDNAARYGQYMFGALNRLPVALAAPSLFTLYQQPPDLSGALVIGISQSGQSPDIVSVLQEAGRQGVPGIAITNDLDSPLAKAAGHVIGLHVGEERSVAATKTYTAQLTALALLGLGLSGQLGQDNLLSTVPAVMEQSLQAEAQAQSMAGKLAASDRAIVIGRGFNYATAHEISLKCKELAYVLAEPYSSADFRHGPIAMVETDFPVLLVTMGETFRQDLSALDARLREQGVQPLTLGDQPFTENAAHIPVPGGLPEWLTPLVAILPGQLLAYHLARARGFDPDQPRVIRKVTLTH
jgi:glucosamine--fructose-6-phosphate aminotransferase (isomerizing)